MKNFWAQPENNRIYKIGKFLTIVLDGNTLAQRLAAREEIPIEYITLDNGLVVPLEPGFKLSLMSIAKWGCPACNSAHGSGVFPSREVDADGLARCEFYYNPATKRLFMISKTCWLKYVKALGFATEEQFIDVPDSVGLVDEPAKSCTEELSACVSQPQRGLLSGMWAPVRNWLGRTR
jgi:hypothetical protein